MSFSIRRQWIVSRADRIPGLRGLAGAVSGAFAFAATARADAPMTLFSPADPQAQSIYGISLFVLAITLGIFIVVAGLLTFVLIRYRQRPGDDNREPAQIYGSNQIELSWTVIPILIVVTLFLTTTRVILGTEAIEKPKGALEVTVIGHQFWWEYHYPKLGIVTANELHVPVSDAQHPTYLEVTSADVTHSFFVPRLAGRMDVIPNRVNEAWIDPPQPGLFLGQCGQYCGTQHAKMLLRVYVQSQSDFDAWVKAQQQPARQDFSSDPAAAEGERVFMHNACMNCHAIAGTAATGRFGPDLTHLASRDTIASGAVPNTPANLRQWIDDPNSLKPGCLMPSMHLDGHDLDTITAYLSQLR